MRGSRTALRVLGWVLVGAALIATFGAWRLWREPHLFTRFYVAFLGWALLVGARSGATPREASAARVVAVASLLAAGLDLGLWLAAPPWQYWAAFVLVVLFGFLAAPALLLSRETDAGDSSDGDAW